jgi:hypothetical protein
MDDRQKEEALTPRSHRQVTERELQRVLDESLWQVERRRVADVGGNPERS